MPAKSTTPHIFLIFAALILSSGCQVYNSSSQDDQRYAGGTPEEKARGVLANRCASCHSFHTATLSSLISSGHVSPGVPASSTMLTRIRGAGFGGNENMPPSETVGASEIEAIQKWIEGVQAP